MSCPAFTNRSVSTAVGSQVYLSFSAVQHVSYFRVSTNSSRSVPLLDDEILTKNAEGRVILYNVSSGLSKVLVEDSMLVSSGNFTFSSDYIIAYA